MSTKKTKAKKEVKLNEANPLKLDLGCGQRCTVDENGVKFTGVDFYPNEGVDIVHDLTKFPYPFKDGSVDEIVSNHFIEHLDGSERCKFINECYRILKVGGTMKLTHPNGHSDRAHQDWTHKYPPIVSSAYFYFDKKWREMNGLDHYYPITGDWEYSIFVAYHGDKGVNWNTKAPEALGYAMGHNINVVADLIVHLKKR